MKHGIIWFLHLNRVIFGAKIAFIPLVIAGIRVVPFSPIFFVIWSLCLICVIIAGVSVPLRTPSADAIEHFIEEYESEFEDRHKKAFAERHRQLRLLKLRCYAPGKTLKLKRTLHGRVVYGTLVMLAVAASTDGKWLVRETKSLCSNRPAETEVVRIEEPGKLRVYVTPYHNGNSLLTVDYGDMSIDVFAYDDYHITDFVALLRGDN
jgi:hypothetical protein